MEKYELRTNDFVLIDKLLKKASSIDEVYNKLYELEIAGKKETDEYKKLLEILSATINEENKIYEEAILTYSRCVAILNFLLNKKLPKNFLSNMESIMQQDYSNRALRRTAGVFVHKIIEDCESVKEMVPDDLLDFMEEMGASNPDTLVSHAIYSNIELQKAFEKDILNGFLTILQENIEIDAFKIYREFLIASKYNVAFINKSIEPEIINNHFNIQDTFYINSRIIADLTKTDLELYELLKNSFGINEATKQILKVLEIGDMDYSDSNKATTSILRQCLMRAAFLLIGDDIISEVKSEFVKFVEDKDYLDKHQNDQISKQLVENCFNSVGKDKNKINVISFGRR